MMKRSRRLISAASAELLVAAMLVWLLNLSWAATQSPYEFTYQGRLFVGSPPTTPANGQYSFRFGVFANASDPELDHEVITVEVADGYFTARLVGLDQLNLNGQVRWLDIKVKASNDAQPWSSIPSLSGWQKLSPSPYAGYAMNSGKLDGHTSSDFVLIDGAPEFQILDILETYPTEDYLYLSDSQINLRHAWIDMGASAPRQAGTSMWAHPVQIGSPASVYGSEFHILSNATVENEQYHFIDDTLPARSIWLSTTNAYDHVALLRSPANPSGTPDFGMAQLLVNSNNEVYLYKVSNASAAATNTMSDYVKLYVATDTDTVPLDTSMTLFVRDNAGNITQLATHCSPASVVSDAVSSFGDSEIEYPWSFHHKNVLLGKGAVVDMAKVMKWAERKMQSEEGSDQGRVFYYYDLGPAETISFDEYVEQMTESVINKKISESPWVEVTLSSGKLPVEAWEEVEVCEEREVEELKIETEIDWNSLDVKEVPKYEKVRKQVPTGRYERKLKSDYKVDKGKLYRKTTVDDIEITDKDIPSLPGWILDRIPEGRLSKEELRRRVEMSLAVAIDEAKSKSSVATTDSQKPANGDQMAKVIP